MFRVGELSYSPHVIKARDVHIADNKLKVLIMLYSSKTHGRESLPQKIKIKNDNTVEVVNDSTIQCMSHSKITRKKLLSPIYAINEYSNARGPRNTDTEQYFVFRDGSPVKPIHIRQVLRVIIKKLGLDAALYDTHSLRIGRATDLQKQKCSVEEIKVFGRWKSKTVYKYLRN